MKKTFITTLTILISLNFTHDLQAETSVSFELLIPALAVEFSNVSDNNIQLAGKIQITSDEVYGGEINLTKARDENGKHWWGGGIGHMQDDNDGWISVDFDTYVSINYKYYARGIDNEGFYFNSTLRGFKDGVFPFFGFGYNF